MNTRINPKFAPAFLMLCSLICACGKPVAPHSKARVLDIKIGQIEVPTKIDYSNLESTLKIISTTERANMKKFRVNDLETPLNKQLATMAKCGPSTTPDLFKDKRTRLVFWLNARTAWTVKFSSLIDEDRYENPNAPPPIPGTFVVDGQKMTLQDIDSRILATGSFMHTIAAPGIFPERAIIPGSVFSSDSLDREISRSINAFIDSPGRITVDAEARIVFFPNIIWKNSQRLKDNYRSRYGGPKEISLLTAFLPLTSGSAHRKLQDVVGYKCQCRAAK